MALYPVLIRALCSWFVDQLWECDGHTSFCHACPPGDERTANDTYNFLLGFLERHPQYAKTPFWVSGESYGGHYVPTAAQAIIRGNLLVRDCFHAVAGVS